MPYAARMNLTPIILSVSVTMERSMTVSIWAPVTLQGQRVGQSHRIVNRQKGHSALFQGHGFFRACVSMGFVETRPVV